CKIESKSAEQDNQHDRAAEQDDEPRTARTVTTKSFRRETAAEHGIGKIIQPGAGTIARLIAIERLSGGRHLLAGGAALELGGDGLNRPAVLKGSAKIGRAHV